MTELGEIQLGRWVWGEGLRVSSEPGDQAHSEEGAGEIGGCQEDAGNPAFLDGLHCPILTA